MAVFKEEDLAGLVGPLLTNLFAALKDQRHTENEYIMKCKLINNISKAAVCSSVPLLLLRSC